MCAWLSSTNSDIYITFQFKARDWSERFLIIICHFCFVMFFHSESIHQECTSIFSNWGPVSESQKFLSWKYGCLHRQLKLLLFGCRFGFHTYSNFVPYNSSRIFSFHVKTQSYTGNKQTSRNSDCIYLSMSLNIYWNLLCLKFLRKKIDCLLLIG